MIHIGSVDQAVVVFYLACVVALGLWIGRGRQNAAQYLLGGRDTPWWAVLGSIVATETSTITFLSIPALTFADDGNCCFLQLAIGYIVGRLLIVWLLLPHFFRGQLFTAYQVLHERFGGVTQQVASVVFLTTRNLGDGLRLFLTALVLEKTIGVSLTSCVVMVGMATIVYTFVGGMKSVIWNDCIQLVVYVTGGIVALSVVAGRMPDGMSQILEFAHESGRLQVFDFTLDFEINYTFWSGLVGGAFLTLGTHGTDQMMVQRLLASRSQRDAAKALIASGFVVFLQFSLFLFVGMALACFYDFYPPRGGFRSADHVFASFIVDELPRNIGLIGFLLAAVFSAAMSTLSSSLNSSAAAVVHDWYLPWIGQQQTSEGKLVWISRGLTIGFGVLQILIGISAQFVDDLVINNALAIAGFAAGLLLGLFALGGLTKWVGQTGALIGLLCGLLAMVLVKFAPPILNAHLATLTSLFGTAGGLLREDVTFELPVIAWPWLPVIGSIVTLTAGCLASWFLRLTNKLAS